MDEDAPGKLKQEYISAINNLLQESNDIELMDFVFQLLQKAK